MSAAQQFTNKFQTFQNFLYLILNLLKFEFQISNPAIYVL